MSSITNKNLSENLETKISTISTAFNVFDGSKNAQGILSVSLQKAIMDVKRNNKPKNRAARAFEVPKENLKTKSLSSKFVTVVISPSEVTSPYSVIVVNSKSKNKPRGWFANFVKTLIKY